MTNFEKLCEQLEAKIVDSYEHGVTLEAAEKLAGEFLYAQLAVSTELKKCALSARMRKSGVKAIRAAIYTDTCNKSEKKPTETALDHLLNSNDLVVGEQGRLDAAEVEVEELERYFNIFQNAHIHFRGISKGRFE